MGAQEGLASLRSLCAQASLLTDGGTNVAHLPGVQFQAGAQRVRRDLLLWPCARDGYETRLFLSGQVVGSVQRAWKSFQLCGRTWWAVSWQGVPATLPWIEIVASHLRAFK
jgi:hypothetical protein